MNWLLTHYSRLQSAPDHEAASRPQGRDQHEGLGASQRAGGGAKTRGCRIKSQAVQHTATNAAHAATQSSKKQKHHGPRSRKVKKAMNVEAKAHKLRTKHE